MTGKKPIKLKEQHKIFVDAYLADPARDIAKAYRKAFPKCKTNKSALSAGDRLLNSVEYKSVQEYLQQRSEFIRNESNEVMEAREVQVLLTKIGRGELCNKELRYTSVGVQELVDVPARLTERIRALELMGKSYALFTEKVDMTAALNVTVEYDYGEDEEG